MKSFRCAHCGRRQSKTTGAVNRARRGGNALYCNRTCAGLGRRKHKPKAQKIEEKRLYDAEYRIKNRAMLKAKKAAHFQRTYDPKEAAVKRKERMPYHVEYCRTPEYKAWKKEYDRQFRAREYGPFSESFLLLQDLERELDARATWHERAYGNDRTNKSQRRKRAYDQISRF